MDENYLWFVLKARDVLFRLVMSCLYLHCPSLISGKQFETCVERNNINIGSACCM